MSADVKWLQPFKKGQRGDALRGQQQFALAIQVARRFVPAAPRRTLGPEMIELAGGRDVLGRIHTPSFRVTLDDIVAAAPEIILISPCGYGARQARDEYLSMAHPHEWKRHSAVQSGRVYALEANSYFSRPGPRLITGIEALAKVFHPSMKVGQKPKRRRCRWQLC